MTATDYHSTPQLGKCFDHTQGFYSLYMIMTFPSVGRPQLTLYAARIQGISKFAKRLAADKKLNAVLDAMAALGGGPQAVEAFARSRGVTYEQMVTGLREQLEASEEARVIAIANEHRTRRLRAFEKQESEFEAQRRDDEAGAKARNEGMYHCRIRHYE